MHCFRFIFMKRFLKTTLSTWGLSWQTLNLFQDKLKLVLQIMRACCSTYICKVKIDCCFLLDISHPKLWNQHDWKRPPEKKSRKVWWCKLSSEGEDAETCYLVAGSFYQNHPIITKKASETEEGITDSENLLRKMSRLFTYETKQKWF